MTVEREQAGFVLPFAAGIFLAAGQTLIKYPYLPAAATLSLAFTSLILISILNPAWKARTDVSMDRLIIGVLGLCAGIFMGSSAGLMDISSSEPSIITWASGFGRRLGEAVDALQFTNRDTNAIIKALITGERNDIPRNVTEAFRESGASHILSLSGFHLGIIYGIVRFLLAALGNRPGTVRTKSVITVSLCGLYTLATGAGPSIVRAFLFILLGETARLLHRRQTTASFLLSALLIQLAISPASITSVSFQLSYAAMAGIAFIYPYLRDFWPGIPQNDRPFTRGVRWIWNSAALSISCQLTTAPLAWLYFDSFPVHFLLTNLIALPLTSLIIPLALATLVLTTLGLCPAIIPKATEALTQALSAALEIIANM